MLWGWLDALIDCWTCLGESELHVYGESKLHVYVSMFMGRVNYMCMCTCVWGEWITCVYVHVYGESELRVYVYMEAKSPSMWVFLVCLWHGVAHWCLWLSRRLDWLASKLQGSHLGSQYCEYTSAPSISCVGVGVVYTCVPVCGSQKSMLSSSIVVHLIFFCNCLTLNLELANWVDWRQSWFFIWRLSLLLLYGKQFTDRCAFLLLCRHAWALGSGPNLTSNLKIILE